MYNKLRTADNICPGYLQLLLFYIIFLSTRRNYEVLTRLLKDRRLRSDSQTTRTDDDDDDDDDESTACKDHVQLGIMGGHR